MASLLDIGKLALHYVGDRTDMSALTDATTEAEAVDLVMDHEVEKFLKEHNWAFARAWTEPDALDVTEPAGWTYAFAYPDDALKVWLIVNPLGEDEPAIPFTIGTLSTGRKVILTDEEEPEFEYTRNDVVAEDFSPHFVEGLARRVAASITMTLTGDRALHSDNLQLALRMSEHAKVIDGNEGVPKEHNRDPDWIRGRA